MQMRIVVALSALLLLWGRTAAGDDSVVIKDAWARATPPNIKVGAVFMQINSKSTDELLAVTSPIATKAEIHNVTERDGRFEMRQLQTVTIPANRAVELSPTGLHIMLMGLQQPLRADASFEVTLTFKHAGERTVTVSVVAPGAK